jgi:hypothetical protein
MPKGPRNNNTNLHIRINEELMSAINDCAKLRGIKTSALIRKVLTDFLIVEGNRLEDMLPPRGYRSSEVGDVVTKEFLE